MIQQNLPTCPQYIPKFSAIEKLTNTLNSYMFLTPRSSRQSTHYYSWSSTPANIQHKLDTTTRLLFEPEFQQIRFHSEAPVLKSLEEVCDHPDLPFNTDDEAVLLLDKLHPTIQLLRNAFFLFKLRLLTQVDLQQLLQHRSWQYKKSAAYNFDDRVLELRMFVMFVFHEYIDPNHYQSPQVLCEDLSSQLTDILRKLHTEALNLLNMELYARYIVTTAMNERLFIMVCRHFAYAGAIDKILPFQDEFEQMMDDIPYYSRQLYNNLYGLLIPFRIGRLPVTDVYDPNDPNLVVEQDTRPYQRLNRMLRRLSIIHQRVQPQYSHTHPFTRTAEDFQRSFADDGI